MVWEWEVVEWEWEEVEWEWDKVEWVEVVWEELVQWVEVVWVVEWVCNKIQE